MALRGGIDLGGTKIQTAIVDPDGKVSGEARHPTPHEGGPEAVAERWRPLCARPPTPRG